MIRLTYFKGIILFLLAFPTWGQDLSPLRFNEAWKHKIFTLAPEEPRFPSQEKQRLLVFSLHTGFEHWVIPHTEEMISLVAEKSGAFEVVRSKDIAWFEPDSLAQFDALILNNTCSKPDHRHLFWDQLRAQFPLEDSIPMMQKALLYEEHLLNYVKEGGGLLLIHGAVTTLNNSSRFSAMVGASFDYHPPQQLVHVQLEDPSHPLVAGFQRKDGHISMSLISTKTLTKTLILNPYCTLKIAKSGTSERVKNSRKARPMSLGSGLKEKAR